MSQPTRDTNEDSDPESSNDSSQLYSSGTTSSSAETGACSSSSGRTSSSGCNACKDSDNSSDQRRGHVCRTAPLPEGLGERDPNTEGRKTNVTEERSNISINKSDDVIQRSRSTTGQQCDTIATTRTLKTSCPNSPRLQVSSRDQIRQPTELGSQESYQHPSTSYLLDCSNKMAQTQISPNTVKPAPSVSSTIIDTNNNKNLSNPSAKTDYMYGRNNNFSKSTSGSRLVHKNNPRSNVCDCLSQNCSEKEHSNRRQFIENYYNSRTRLPSAIAMSTLNISSPLNRLSECDAITRRLLSSPIRGVNFPEKPFRREHSSDIDKTRRASLGTSSLTEQVSLFSSNQFNSLESGHEKRPDSGADDNQEACDSLTGPIVLSRESDFKLKQPPGRSLSVCQEKSLKPQFKNTSSNNYPNLNRTVSLACEPSSSKQLLTIIPLFGCDIKALEQFMKLGLVLPPAIDSAVDHLLNNGIDSVGIFRKSGVKSRILALRQMIEANQDACLDEINRGNEFSIYDIADLVKMWFRELKPVPIMTKEMIKIISDFLQTNASHENATSSQQRKSLLTKNQDLRAYSRQQRQPPVCNLKQQIDAALSPAHKALFSKTLNFFATISANSEVNQMTSQNLAICLTPSLCATDPDQNSIVVGQKALKYCIDNYRILF